MRRFQGLLHQLAVRLERLHERLEAGAPAG